MKIELADYVVTPDAKISDAMTKLEKNHNGIVFVYNENKMSGALTDGDIRRHLLNDGSLETKVASVCNTDFAYGLLGESRESLLKKFDNGIRTIPILDQKNGKFVNVIRKEHFPIQHEQAVSSRARAPVRVSFGGGGSDVTNYFTGEAGAVISSTISLFSHATLTVRQDRRLKIHSRDLGLTITLDDVNDLQGADEPKFGLILAVLNLIKPDFGFDLTLYSDFPAKSGLGGSSALVASILGCFNEMRRDKWDLYELSDLAYQAERHTLGISGGWQDQYATVFGGMNFIEFSMDENIVHPLRIPHTALLELEESLVLCWVGGAHDGGSIHDDQRKMTEKSVVKSLVSANVEICRDMRDELLRGRLGKIGQLMHKAWQIKRQLSSKISTPYLDSIYEAAITNGALGGKLLGAGGGGFFLFFVSPPAKASLMDSLETLNLKVRAFRFDTSGMQSWVVREDNRSI